MTLQPPSRREEFRDLPKFYDEEIAPFLRSQESIRKTALKKGANAMKVAVPVAILVFVAGPFGDKNLLTAIIVLALGGAMYSHFIMKASAQISAGLLERVCKFFGFQYRQEPSRPIFATEFDRMKLLPEYDDEAWEDEVTGVRHGAGFFIYEAVLKKTSTGRNRRTKKVFHGQLFVIDYPKKFYGETVIQRDTGVLNRFSKPGNEFKKVGLVSSKFEKAFEAWSTDQVEARELLDPLVLERFEELERLFDGANFRGAFSNGKLFVALETGDKLNMGSMFETLEQPERVNVIMKEFDLIFDLIDVALKQIDGPMSGAVSASGLR